MDQIQQRGVRFDSRSSVVASGSASVVQAAVSEQVHYVTEIGASAANATAQISVFETRNNVRWQAVLGAVGTTGPYEKVFRVPIRGTSGSAFIVEVIDTGGGTGSTIVNMAGYTV